MGIDCYFYFANVRGLQYDAGDVAELNLFFDRNRVVEKMSSISCLKYDESTRHWECSKERPIRVIYGFLELGLSIHPNMFSLFLPRMRTMVEDRDILERDRLLAYYLVSFFKVKLGVFCPNDAWAPMDDFEIDGRIEEGYTMEEALAAFEKYGGPPLSAFGVTGHYIDYFEDIGKSYPLVK